MNYLQFSSGEYNFLQIITGHTVSFWDPLHLETDVAVTLLNSTEEKQFDTK